MTSRCVFSLRGVAVLSCQLLSLLAACSRLAVDQQPDAPANNALSQQIDNCLLLDASPDAPLKLVDWGYAAFVAPGAPRLHKLCGTCTYVAPEVVAGDYDERADVWWVPRPKMPQHQLPWRPGRCWPSLSALLARAAAC